MYHSSHFFSITKIKILNSESIILAHKCSKHYTIINYIILLSRARYSRNWRSVWPIPHLLQATKFRVQETSTVVQNDFLPPFSLVQTCSLIRNSDNGFILSMKRANVLCSGLCLIPKKQTKQNKHTTKPPTTIDNAHWDGGGERSTDMFQIKQETS